MQAPITWPVPVRAARLHQELQAAFPALVPVAGPDGLLVPQYTLEHTPEWVRLTLPDGIDLQAVAAVVNAHDPDVLSTDEVQQSDDVDALAAFVADYPDMLDRLDTIQGLMTSIKGRADTLAGLSTWSGLTLAQTTARLQQVMPALGTDLGTIATEFRAVAIGLENMLRALAVLKRRAGG